MLDLNTIKSTLQTLTNKYAAKGTLPDWFALNLKTLLTKNITLEDWNTLQQYLKNVVSQSESIYEFCQDLVANLETSNTNINETFNTVNNTLDNIDETIKGLKTELVTLSKEKVDKVEGKELSTNDFTNEFKEKLENLENYDDSELKENLEQQTSRDYLIETIGNATQSLEGLMTAKDKEHLDTLVNLLKDEDENSIVDTIAEILKVFKNYAEGTDIVNILASKLDKPSPSSSDSRTDKNRAIIYWGGDTEQGIPHLKPIDCSCDTGDWAIVERNPDGQTEVADPTEVLHATNKRYVDNADNYIKANVTMKDRTFKNPVIENTATEDYFPDPTVWSGDDGYFYSLATSYGKHLFRSVDLVNWEDCGYSPIDNETVTKLQTELGYNKIWAPSVHKVGTKWLMYIAGVHDRYASGYNNDDHTGIIVLTANKCNGYFTFANVILTSTSTGIKDCIDPFLDYDPLTNKLQLYFGSTGGIHRVDMSANGLNIKSGATPEHVAGLTIEEDSTREQVFEGAYVYYRNNYKYLFVSSGNAATRDYKLKVGRASLQEDGTWSDFITKMGSSMLTGAAETLFSTAASNYNGAGHNGNIFTDRLGKTYIFYHTHIFLSSLDNWKRATFLQELKWYGNWCYFTDMRVPLQKEICPYLPSPQPNMIGYPNTLHKENYITKRSAQQFGYHTIKRFLNAEKMPTITFTEPVTLLVGYPRRKHKIKYNGDEKISPHVVFEKDGQTTFTSLTLEDIIHYFTDLPLVNDDSAHTRWANIDGVFSYNGKQLLENCKFYPYRFHVFYIRYILTTSFIDFYTSYVHTLYGNVPDSHWNIEGYTRKGIYALKNSHRDKIMCNIFKGVRDNLTIRFPNIGGDEYVAHSQHWSTFYIKPCTNYQPATKASAPKGLMGTHAIKFSFHIRNDKEGSDNDWSTSDMFYLEFTISIVKLK